MKMEPTTIIPGPVGPKVNEEYQSNESTTSDDEEEYRRIEEYNKKDKEQERLAEVWVKGMFEEENKKRKEENNKSTYSKRNKYKEEDLLINGINIELYPKENLDLFQIKLSKVISRRRNKTVIEKLAETNNFLEKIINFFTSILFTYNK